MPCARSWRKNARVRFVYERDCVFYLCPRSVTDNTSGFGPDDGGSNPPGDAGACFTVALLWAGTDSGHELKPVGQFRSEPEVGRRLKT